jgi:hypothetical protein
MSLDKLAEGFVLGVLLTISCGVALAIRKLQREDRENEVQSSL